MNADLRHLMNLLDENVDQLKGVDKVPQQSPLLGNLKQKPQTSKLAGSDEDTSDPKSKEVLLSQKELEEKLYEDFQRFVAEAESNPVLDVAKSVGFKSNLQGKLSQKVKDVTYFIEPIVNGVRIYNDKSPEPQDIFSVQQFTKLWNRVSGKKADKSKMVSDLEQSLKALKESTLTETSIKTVRGYQIAPGEDLRDADLQDADLLYADLSGANLQGADLRDANLRHVNLRDAKLQGANLRDANLFHADLQGADLLNANLTGADLSGADLQGADLQGAKLQGVDLFHADLRGANLQGADLTNSKINEYTWFLKTKITESQLLKLRLSGWKLTKEQLSGLILIKD